MIKYHIPNTIIDGEIYYTEAIPIKQTKKVRPIRTRFIPAVKRLRKRRGNK